MRRSGRETRVGEADSRQRLGPGRLAKGARHVSGRRGPMTRQRGPLKDMTADVQEWLDQKPDEPDRPADRKAPVIKT